MIHYIRFSNFYSFLDEQEISFVVDKRAPDGTGYVQSAFGPRLTRVLACFGANASGKTNALKTVAFLRTMACDSYGFRPEERLPFSPFAGQADKGHTTDFEVLFEMEDRLVRYSFAATPERLLNERLDTKGTEGNFRRVVSRTFDPDSQSYTVRINRKLGLFSTRIHDNALRHRGNASLIAIAAQAEDPFCGAVQRYWQQIHVDPVLTHRAGAGRKERVQWASRFFLKNKEHLRTAEKIARKWDLGIDGIQVYPAGVATMTVAEEQAPYGDVPEVEAIVTHTSNGHRFDMPIHMESGGTQEIFIRMAEILPIIEAGGFAVLDEADLDLHPYLVEALLDLFRSKYPTHHSRLFCTLHNVAVMNTLDKCQILLVEKNEALRSELWRLDELEGVRNDENFLGAYMSGVYDAVPDVY
ncbi:MAG: AAA family ATPase [Candidatus Hydrogenedentota bacterium]